MTLLDTVELLALLVVFLVLGVILWIVL